MKVYLHYTEAEPNLTIKVKLPKKWRTGPTDNLKGCIVDNYNKKHATADGDTPAAVTPFDAAAYHLTLKDGTELLSDAVVQDCVKDGADVFLTSGPSKTVAEVKAVEDAKEAAKKEKESKLISCKNFGCQMKFDPAENNDQACVYHVAPPKFHETNKWWSCCPHKKGYDWETFQAIRGCKVGRHSAEKAGPKFLGGSDVRAANDPSAPKRIDGGGQPAAPSAAPAASNPVGKVVTPLEKLLVLRKALISLGVPGAEFDRARDIIKTEHESKGAEVWQIVCEKLSEHFVDALQKV